MEKVVIQDKNIILFDGVCHLCNGFVQFVIRQDKKQQFHFASLQSDLGQSLLKQYDLPKTLNTVVYIENNKSYVKSDVGLLIFRRLGGWWKYLYYFYYLPRFIRDRVYDWIARNRYQWFGKSDQCMMPTPDIRSRFLDL